ncbi:unnamed protein product [Pleuronectes platessa]|uniref:Uncharacterized protein n=1 Tax=Pleuronectes platessa TaxID=8262 RepID=A0A9N7UYF3_PLEPL|nr:unnamed protein product [Pleuronectes platessa]
MSQGLSVGRRSPVLGIVSGSDVFGLHALCASPSSAHLPETHRPELTNETEAGVNQLLCLRGSVKSNETRTLYDPRSHSFYFGPVQPNRCSSKRVQAENESMRSDAPPLCTRWGLLPTTSRRRDGSDETMTRELAPSGRDWLVEWYPVSFKLPRLVYSSSLRRKGGNLFRCGLRVEAEKAMQ